MNISSSNVNRLLGTWMSLKLTYGLVFVLAGLDKFFNLVAHWVVYVNPYVFQIMPIDQTYIMWFAGVIEILLGIWVLTAWTRMGALWMAGWLTLIALNFIFNWTHFDIAIRDLVMAAGALALANLTTVVQHILQTNPPMQNQK